MKEATSWILLIAALSVLLLAFVSKQSHFITYGDGKFSKESNGGADSRLLQILKEAQIKNYKRGEALIFLAHITHHAGTSICSLMRKLGPSPDFACMGQGKNKTTPWPQMSKYPLFPLDFNQTNEYVSKYRELFHYHTMEFMSWANLHITNWEHENLVSMIVMRDPIERFLAGGKCGTYHESLPRDPTNETQALYWEYANSKCADNYALKVLTKDNCVQGANTTQECLEGAKTLLKRFTFILDQTCLGKSMVALGEALNLTITENDFESNLHKIHPVSTRDRIANDTLFEYLQTRFRRDIELFEWSKTQSIIRCDEAENIG